MTTVVYGNGFLAADSRVSSRGGQVCDDRNLKIFKIKDITYKDLSVAWGGCAGNVSAINNFRHVLSNSAGKLEDILKPYECSLGSMSFSAVLLLSDGSVVPISTLKSPAGLYRLVYKKVAPKETTSGVGTGSRLIDTFVKGTGITDTVELTYLASRFDTASGGQVFYVDVKSKRVKTFKGFSKRRKVQIMEEISKLLD